MKVSLNFEGNKPVLVRSSAVKEHFDQRNLHLRQNPSNEVLNKYHVNWFEDGSFIVPSFEIDDNCKAIVGAGRHRVILLSRNMDAFPAAFEDERSNENVALYNSIVVRELEDDCVFELPDFPIENLGTDVNIEFFNQT